MLEDLIIKFSYFAVFIFLVSNGAINFPSSQLIYITLGYFIFSEKLNLIVVLIIGTLAVSIGNFILFYFIQKVGFSKKIRDNKFLPFYFVKDAFLDLLQKKLRKKGLWFIIIAKLISVTKIFVPIICALSKMNRYLFISLMLVTNFIWAFCFVMIGFLFGKSFENFGYLGFFFITILIIFIYFLMKHLGISKKDYKNYFRTV